MPRNFDWRSIAARGTRRGPRFWLQGAAAVLLILNAVAVFMYLAPPGGSRRELEAQRDAIRRQIVGTRSQTVHLRAVSSKVQLGNRESSQFEGKYFLPQRQAYEAVISEIERMANASGLHERDAAYTEEPIEGTADLSLLNVTANYQGPYVSLTHFLNEADKSPMLLMLDTVTASPQQRTADISTTIRFQVVVRDSGAEISENGAAGGRP